MIPKIRKVSLVILIILVAFALMLSSMISANIVVHAQQELPNIMISPKKAPVNATVSPSFPSSSSISSPKIHSVKITSPTPGQRVAIGKDLAISGTSMDNANSNSCQVSVIVNSIRPYQPTIPAGPGGANDYSKWNFVLSPSKYTSIKAGPNNKITSKYACTDSPTATSYNSVNVTGIAIGIGTAPTTTSTTAAPTTIIKKPVPVSNNATIVGYASRSGEVSNPGSHVVSITPPSSTVPATNQVKPVFNSNIMPNLNSSELHIKITSPIEGQPISAGKNFTMSGTSSDNSATDCRVYAGLNRLKPYPPAIAAGPGGTADYSKWYFNYSPAYHTATDGNNRLTAKLSCNGDPSLVKYDTMNITAVTTTKTTELPISSPNTPPDTTTKVNQLPSTKDNSQSTSSHDPNKIGSGSSSTTSNTGSTTSDNTDKSIQTHTKIKIRHDIPIKNNKKSNELANNIIKDVKRHLKEGTLADSAGAAASAGSASAYAGPDGVSVSAGGINLNLP